MISRVLDVVVITAAAGVIAAAMTRERQGGSIEISKEDWTRLLADAREIGAERSQTTLVEFVDYQCPVCVRMEAIVSQLEESAPGRIRRVVRHFPISSIHSSAEGASIAAECAALQGRFPEMHRTLLSNQSLVELAKWDTLALLAGVRHIGQFNACLTSEPAKARVRSDVSLGNALGVNGTPTFILDREWLTNVAPPQLRERIQRKLR